MPHMIRINDSTLHKRLKAFALKEGRTAVSVTESALNAYMKKPADVAAPPHDPVICTKGGTPKRRPKLDAVSPSTPDVGKISLPTFPPDSRENYALPGCRRCGHPASQHYGSGKVAQPRCNVAGCPCARLM
jgi:hypothetical protein